MRYLQKPPEPVCKVYLFSTLSAEKVVFEESGGLMVVFSYDPRINMGD